VARNQNTFEKQRREVEKKRKAAEKRSRRLHKKDRANQESTVQPRQIGDDEPGDSPITSDDT